MQPDPTPRIGEVRVRVFRSVVSHLQICWHEWACFKAHLRPLLFLGLRLLVLSIKLDKVCPNIKEGDAVFGFTRQGGYSTVVCVPHTQIFKRLEWMPPADAAAISAHYLMAYMMLSCNGVGSAR